MDQQTTALIWWLIAVFGIFVTLMVMLGFVIGPVFLTGLFKNFGLNISTYLITLLVGAMLSAVWQEPGWRGFALPLMQKRYGAFSASIILGVLWALWHIPGYFAGWNSNAFVLLLGYCIGFSIFATWVFNNTRGSMLFMILLHASGDAAFWVVPKMLPINLSTGMASFVLGGWSQAFAALILAALALILTTGTLSLAKHPVDSL